MSDHRLAACRCGDPSAVGPGRIVPHVLIVTTGEFGDPIAGIVLVKTGNSLMQGFG